MVAVRIDVRNVSKIRPAVSSLIDGSAEPLIVNVACRNFWGPRLWVPLALDPRSARRVWSPLLMALDYSIPVIAPLLFPTFLLALWLGPDTLVGWLAICTAILMAIIAIVNFLVTLLLPFRPQVQDGWVIVRNLHRDSVMHWIGLNEGWIELWDDPAAV